MKINFAEIKFRPSLFEEPITDADWKPNQQNLKRRPISWQIADVLWNSKEIEKADVGSRIFKNYGKEIEISDMEKTYIKDAVKDFIQWARIPVLEALGEKAE